MGLRELEGLVDDKAERVEALLGSTFFLFLKGNAFKSGDQQSGLMARALVRSDAFHAYARVIASWGDIPPRSMEAKLRLLAQFSLVFSSCAQLAVGDRPPSSEANTGGLAFYSECLRALKSSQLLEHMCRALLSMQAAAAVAAAAGSLGRAAAHNVAVGVVETSGCVVSALHGIAGKQGVLDTACWGAAGNWRAARRALEDARAVLSGPCLQFLLARELIGARLRLTGGEGPRHGLPEAHLSELAPAPGDRPGPAAPGPLAPPPPPTPSPDRLLARMGAAALVWQMTVSGPRPALVVSGAEPPGAHHHHHQPQQHAAAAAPPPAGLPYRAVHVYDLVAEAVRCVVADAPAEHLPGGSQLTIVEPVLLLVRLVTELSPRHAAARLPGLWAAVTALLRRSQLRVQYSRHRPLCLFGFLLQWGPQAGVEVEVLAEAGAEAAALPERGRRRGQAGGLAEAQGEEVQEDAAAAAAGGAVAAGEAAPPPPGAAGDDGDDAPPGGAPLAADDDAPQGSLPRRAASLRCALSAGLLPALEQLLRRWARPGPVTILSLPHCDAASCLVVLDNMLRSPGVWPALLAHGSVREVASLIVSLRRVARVYAARADVAGAAGKEAVAQDYGDLELAFMSSLAALLEQSAAALQPPGWRAGGSAAAVKEPPAAQPPGGPSAAQPPGWRAGAGDAAGRAGAAAGKELPLNGSLAVSPPPLPALRLEHLRRMGGLPTRGSAAARQQACLAVFSLSQWLPQALRMMTLISSYYYPQHVADMLSRWTLAAALQLLAAKRRLAAAADAEAEAEAALASWRRLLLEQLDVGAWLGAMLRCALAVESYPEARDAVGAEVQAVLPVALDALEVLLVALPPGTGLRVCHPSELLQHQEPQQAPQGQQQGQQQHQGVPRQPALESHRRRSDGAERGGGGTTAAAAAARDDDIVVDDALWTLLVRHGRARLLLALEWWAGEARVRRDRRRGGATLGSFGGGAWPTAAIATATTVTTLCEPVAGAAAAAPVREPPGVGATPAPAAAEAVAEAGAQAGAGEPTPLQRLLGDVLAKYGELDGHPAAVLPTPDEAAAAVAAAGVGVCGNPDCANLEGPSEAELWDHGKTCSRCRAVSYCCGACQLAHWQAGHRTECTGGVQGGSSGGGGAA